MQLVRNAGKDTSETGPKQATGANCGKICNRWQARENVQLVSIGAKHVAGAKRGKTCNRCQARENMQLVPNIANEETKTNRQTSLFDSYAKPF